MATLIEARWVPEFPGDRALELWKDGPKEGMWEVVQRWPMEDGESPERHFVFGGASAERAGWAKYYRCSARIEEAKAKEYD